MPRPPRLDFSGARHHVMNRASSRRHVFTDEEDLAAFQAVLAELPRRFGLRIHGWALMASHFHLMLEVPDGNLSRVMRHLGSELARRTNQRRGWDGPLFRGRFRNRVVVDEPYWRHLLAYLHLNPVAAGHARHPDEATWTSHRAYAGLDPAPPWLTCAELLGIYGSVQTYRAEMEDLVAGASSLPPELDERRLWVPAESTADRLASPEPAVATLTPTVALDQVAELLGIPREDVARPVRGRRGNLARRLAAWWLLRATPATREQVGALLGMTPSAVGRAASVTRADPRAEVRALRERLDARWMAPLQSARPELDGTSSVGTPMPWKS